LVDIAGAVLAVVILTTPDIFSFTAETWGMVEDPEAAKFLTQFFEFIPKMIAVIVVVATIVKAVQTTMALVKGRSTKPFLEMK
jgi:hypothetical protein